MTSFLRYRSHTLRPYVILGIVVIAFALLPVFDSSATISSQNIYDVLQILAGVGIVTLALGLTMIAGEFDLSVSSTFLLGGMIAVLTGVHSPVLGVVYAVGAGVAVGLVQGVTIAKLRMESMTVTLGGFIALLGVVFVISNSQSISLPHNFLREVEVREGGYEAEYGGVLGGIVNAVTASGGDEFHGQVFGFYANRLLTSSKYFPSAGTAKR